VSETGRAVREYRLTAAGRKQLAAEQESFRQTTDAIVAILETA
jgi:DNA-binding PadR family transcriptional regulator